MILNVEIPIAPESTVRDVGDAEIAKLGGGPVTVSDIVAFSVMAPLVPVIVIG